MKPPKIIIAFIAAISLIMSGCEKSGQKLSEETSAAVTEQVTSAVQTTAETEKPKQKIKPLSKSSRNGYYEDEDFSVTAELYTLQSSLYYPDIVHDMGANPRLFVVPVSVRVRNMSDEDKSFDCSGFSLTDGNAGFYLYSSDFENMKNIGSGKTESAELLFLCSLQQASAIGSITYNRTALETGDQFVPEEFKDIIDQQNAEDVRDYLYREHVIHMYSGYYEIAAMPTTYEMHSFKKLTDGEKNYLAVSFTAYNRSDYAQLIDPSGFCISCSGDKSESENTSQFLYSDQGHTYAVEDSPINQVKALYISTDENLMYSPKEAGISLNGAGKLYEIPEFICMNPQGPTDFTIIYDAENYTRARWFSFSGSHKDEPYYSSIERSLLFDRNFGDE